MKDEFGFQAITTRLKQILGIQTDGQLAAALQISSSGYANLKKRGSLPYNQLLALAIQHNINLNWLMTGEDTQLPLTLTTSQLAPDTLNLLAKLTQLNATQQQQVEQQIDALLAFNALSAQVAVLTAQLASTQPPPTA